MNFPHCAQVAVVERIRQIVTTGEVQRDVVCLVTSLTAAEASPERILRLNRGHWGIENKSHWVRDMSFDEDRSQIRTKNGAWMMAALRNLAIGLIRLLHPIKSIAKALRDLEARPHLALAMIGA